VADASQGAIHLGHQEHPDSGEEMLEDIPMPLGGPDKPQASSSADGTNFLAQAVKTPDPSVVKSTDPAQQVLQAPVPGAAAIQAAVPTADISALDPVGTAAVAGAGASGTATRMVVSTTRSSSTSAASTSSTGSVVSDSSVPGLKHTDSVVRALLFALCVGHFIW